MNESHAESSDLAVPSDQGLVHERINDPFHPLHWPMRKKMLALAIVSYASFVSVAQAVCHQSDFVVQGLSYGKTPTQMSYTLSAAIAGLASGPLLWLPVVDHFGEVFCIFWGTLLSLACTVWAGCMTGHNQFVLFAISRWLGASFGSVATVVGPGTILKTFFLQQRGSAFAVFGVSTLFGVQFGGTTSGYIVNFAPWPVQFWWTAGAEVSVILLVLLLLPSTDTDAGRVSKTEDSAAPNTYTRYLAGRIALLSPLVKKSSSRSLLAPLAIAICPITLISGFFLLVAFGWLVAVSTLLAVFLQTPKAAGGYGLSPLSNANFTFTQWAGDIIAEVYVFFLQDRLSLWLCRRRGGIWKPEYRLVLIVPSLVCLCIGLGIFGAALQYHLSIATLAVGTVLIYTGGDAFVPVINNYLAESFIDYPVHAAAALNFYRLIFGLCVPFFIDEWTVKIGSGWVFGMMAFFSLFAACVLSTLVFFGTKIRAMSPKYMQHSEEGAIIER